MCFFNSNLPTTTTTPTTPTTINNNNNISSIETSSRRASSVTVEEEEESPDGSVIAVTTTTAESTVVATVPAGGGHVAGRNWRSLAVLLLGIVEFLCGAALSILAPFYTSEAAEHGLSITASSIVFASVFILQIFLTPVFGRFITKLGSINLVLWGSACAGLANVCFGFVSEIEPGNLFFGVSLLLRGFMAVGESAINTAVYPLARRMASDEYASTVLSIMETLYGLGTTMGPFIGGLLFKIGGFYLPFLVCGTLLVMAGVFASLLLVVKVKKQQDEVQPEENNVKFRTVLKSPGILVACLVVIITGMSTQWYQPTMEPYLASQFGLSAFTASMFLVIDGGVYAVITPVWGLLLDHKLNAKLCMVLGTTVVALSFILLGPVVFPIQPSPLQVGLAMAVHGVGMAANFIGSLTLLSQEVEVGRSVGGCREQAQGIATSLWITCECIGSFFGSFAGGFSYDSMGWSKSCLLVAFLQFGGLILLGMLFCYSLLPGNTNNKGENTTPGEKEKRQLMRKEVVVVSYGSHNNSQQQPAVV